MSFTPAGPRILIRRADEKKETDQGIIIPEQSVEAPQEGTVLAVGPEVADRVQVGQTILFSKYSGTEVELKGEKVLIIHFEDVLGTLDA